MEETENIIKGEVETKRGDNKGKKPREQHVRKQDRSCVAFYL